MEAVEKKDFDLATEEYESIVASCAASDSSVELSNRHIAHAAILTRHILRKTEHRVSIITGSMPELFFNEIRTDLEKALTKGTQVKIIFVNKISPCPGLATMARNFKNLSLLQITESLRDKVSKHVSHFCVSDEKRFRLEEIHGERDFSKNPSIKASANFNLPSVAKQLESSFQQLVSLSVPIV